MTKVEFCADDSNKKAMAHMRNGLQSSSSVRLAVAYWGKDASAQLGITSRNATRVRIICDLYSGCCNPKELEKLLDMGVEIRTCDSFHGKAYIFDDYAVIGSSNASANGLCYEGAETVSNFELNTVVRDAALLAEAQSWFDTFWNQNAVAVDDDGIAFAKRYWPEKRASRRRAGTLTLFDAIARNDPRLRAARIVLYADHGGMDEHAIHTFEESPQGTSTYPDSVLKDYWPFWITDRRYWDPAPGTTVFDYCGADKHKTEFMGLWKVRAHPVLQFRAKGKIVKHEALILADQVQDVSGIRVTRREVREITAALRHVGDARKWKEDKVGNIIEALASEFVKANVFPVAKRTKKA